MTRFALEHRFHLGYLYKWINGESTPARENLERLAAALQVDPAWLLLGDYAGTGSAPPRAAVVPPRPDAVGGRREAQRPERHPPKLETGSSSPRKSKPDALDPSLRHVIATMLESINLNLMALVRLLREKDVLTDEEIDRAMKHRKEEG